MRGRAVFDRTGRYRYLLTREWDRSMPNVAFVLLNPNRADAVRDDPTIRRCVAFARAWGYGSLSVTNLFAWRALDFRDVRSARDPVGPRNDAHVRRAAARAALVVLAWGAQGAYHERDQTTLALLAGRPLHVLRRTRTGQPSHPLYLPGRLRPRRTVFATAR